MKRITKADINTRVIVQGATLGRIVCIGDKGKTAHVIITEECSNNTYVFRAEDCSKVVSVTEIYVAEDGKSLVRQK